jgi:hypothetical protein
VTVSTARPFRPASASASDRAFPRRARWRCTEHARPWARRWSIRVASGCALAVMRVVAASAAFADSVTVTPTANGLTFGSKIQNLLNWTAQGALWASLASILIGAGIWGLSKHFGNYGGASKGLQLVIGGAIGALVVATAPAIVNSMFAG